MMKDSNKKYIEPKFVKAINALIWESIKNPEYGMTARDNYIKLLDKVIGIGFILDNGVEDDETLDFSKKDRKALLKISEAIYELKNNERE